MVSLAGATGQRHDVDDNTIAKAGAVSPGTVEELAAAGRSATWPECPEHPNVPMPVAFRLEMNTS